MDFSLNEVQAMLADSIDKFLARDYDFETRQNYAQSDRGYSEDVWRSLAELGWTALPFSEESGGLGGGPIELMVASEHLGRGLVVEPWLANIVLAGGILKRAASEKQKSEWLQPIISGDLQATLAFVERQARYDLSNVAATAAADGDNWILNGSKGYVLNGANADLIIVPARTSGAAEEAHGITLFAVAAGSEGLSIQDYPTIDGQRASELTMQDVSVGSSNRIGDLDQGFTILDDTILEATLATCAEAVGIMTVLTEKTIEYAKNRVQFGVPISSFQALQHRMVEMYTACEQSRSLLLWASMVNAEGGDGGRQAVHAIKYQVGVAGKRVGEEAIQIHGGMGVTWEMDVAHYFKRLTAIGLLFGNSDWHLGRYLEQEGGCFR